MNTQQKFRRAIHKKDALAFPMSPEVWAAVTKQLAFSPQQSRVVELILCCQSDKQIAREMGLGESTIRTYLDRIGKQLGISGRLELVVYVFALAQRLVEAKCSR